ncbi:hypothetical protein Noda2021_03770 [Candidatus Dependentiae bacterium Noda2021]|nr:hypothetical protein Noda2021_03770 [Candidatus Dependentiae bacterium Noda2021]
MKKLVALCMMSGLILHAQENKEFTYNFAIHFEQESRVTGGLSLPVFKGQVILNKIDIYEAQRAAVALASDIRESISNALAMIRRGLQNESSFQTVDIIARELPLLVRFQPLIKLMVNHKIPDLTVLNSDLRALKAIAALTNPNKYAVNALSSKINALQPLNWKIVLKHSLEG